MGSINFSRKLDASPVALWGIVADPRTWGDWFSIHDRWMEEPPAELTTGTKLVAKIVMLGMANKLDWTIDEVDPPNTLVLSGTGMAGVKTKFTFSIASDGEGSTLTVAGEFDGAMIKGALGKAVEKDGTKQLEQSLTALEKLAAA